MNKKKTMPLKIPLPYRGGEGRQRQTLSKEVTVVLPEGPNAVVNMKQGTSPESSKATLWSASPGVGVGGGVP